MTEETNVPSDMDALKALVSDHEQAIELLEERLGQTMQLVSQMDIFLREMLKAGHFEATVQRLQGGIEEKPKIIL